MPAFIGRLINLGVAKEATRGVGVAPSRWVPKVTLTVDDVAEKVSSVESRGGIWAFGNEELVTGKHAEGEIELEAGNEILGLFLLATFGTVSSASFLGSYKHTYSLQNDNVHDSLTLTIDDEVGQFQFEKAMINSLTIEASLGELVMANFAVMANPHTDTSGHTATYLTDYKFAHQHVSLKVAADTASLAAASAAAIKNLSLTISKNVVVDNVLGTVQPNDINNQQFLIEGSFQLNFEDVTTRNLMLDGTYQAMRIDIVNASVTIGSTNPAFRLDLSRVAFFDWTKDQPNDELVTQTINFRALYDVTNGNVINDCYLVNDTASY